MAYTNTPADIDAIVRGLHKHGAVLFVWQHSGRLAPSARFSVDLYYGSMQITGEAPNAAPNRRFMVALSNLAARATGLGGHFEPGFFFERIGRSADEIREIDANFCDFLNAISDTFYRYVQEHGDPVARLGPDEALHPATVPGLSLSLPSE